MSYLELRQVSKSYGAGAGEVHALSDVSLAVERGSLVAVMGPSGSGKSTLLTIAGSLEEPTSGDVVIGGDALSSLSRNDKARLRRRTVGYVFQDFNLLAGLTAAENRATHYPDELSGGERQRVAIARAIVGDRSLLLADEPSGALDSTNGETVMRMILAACHRGVAAMVVTHDAQLASWADRVVFIRDGQVVDQTLPPPTPESFLADFPAPSPRL
ncbi:MAG: ABC transporter ATP-binding protein [Acidimicrobiales bacterium]